MTALVDANGKPFCNTCKHYHEQGTSCEVCGHVGKSGIWRRMQSKATALSGMSEMVIGSGLVGGCDLAAPAAQAHWALIREMRGNLCRAAGSAIEHEFNMAEEADRRHWLYSAGDKPVVCARYSVQLNESNGQDGLVVVDRFGIFIRSYEEREDFVEQCIHMLLNDALAAVNNARQLWAAAKQQQGAATGAATAAAAAAAEGGAFTLAVQETQSDMLKTLMALNFVQIGSEDLGGVKYVRMQAQ